MPDNHFEALWALGYQRLVPIIPPDAEISENSTLARRKDARGKAVGIKRGSKWSGFDWIPTESTHDQIELWHDMGAGVGIKTGLGLIAIDADTLVDAHARIIKDIVEYHLGRLPVRIGRYPKSLYLARVSEDYKYTRVEFGDVNERGYLESRVEILSDKRQFVAHGIHPFTGNPYHWPRDLMPFDELPVFTAKQIDDVMAEIADKLPKAVKPKKEGGGELVNQAALVGPIDMVRKAVANIPNTSVSFGSREAWMEIGYAIKAALPNNPDEAFDLFASWCEKWQDGDNDPDYVEDEWNRYQPPYRVGAHLLYDKAEKLGAFNQAEVWFEPIGDDLNPFAQIEAENIMDRNANPDETIYPVLSIEDLMNRPPPEWLIERYFPKQSVGFVFSAPGAGKTFIVLDAAMHIAASEPDWHGDKISTDPDSVVLYLAAEGSYGFRNRVKAWVKHKEIDGGRLRNFRLIEKSINFMSTEDIDRLIRTIRSVIAQSGKRLALVIVDTVSRSMPGADENLQKDMTMFVKACDTVKGLFGCAVIGVHHANKNGGGMRGSTVLMGAGDFVFELRRKKGLMTGLMGCEKMKDGPDGWEDSYVFQTIDIGEGEQSLAVTRGESTLGPSRTVTPALANEILGAMKIAWDKGEPWSGAPNAQMERRAVRRMVADFGMSGDVAEETLATWEAAGVISSEIYDTKNKSKGYSVGVGVGHAVHNLGFME